MVNQEPIKIAEYQKIRARRKWHYQRKTPKYHLEYQKQDGSTHETKILGKSSTLTTLTEIILFTDVTKVTIHIHRPPRIEHV